MYLEKFIKKNRLLKPVIYRVIDFILKRSRRIPANEVIDNGTIAIVTLHFLGDTVFTIPAIREILKSTSEKVYLLCFPETAPIYKLAFNDRVTCIFIEHDEFIFDDRFALSSARKKLRALNAGIIVDLTAILKSASLIYNCKAKRIVGISHEMFGGLYDRSTLISSSTHLMDIYINAAKQLIEINDNDVIREFPVHINREGKIIIHVCAGWKAKEWDIRKFIQLAEMLNADHSVLIVFPPNTIKDEIKEEMTRLKILFKETETVQVLIDTLKDGFLFIGNDTGTAHISSFIGLPTYILFGPTNPAFHVPLGKYHGFIQKKISCTPTGKDVLCYADGGRSNICTSYQCIQQLEVNEVYNGITDFIAELQVEKSVTADSIP